MIYIYFCPTRGPYPLSHMGQFSGMGVFSLAWHQAPGTRVLSWETERKEGTGAGGISPPLGSLRAPVFFLVPSFRPVVLTEEPGHYKVLFSLFSFSYLELVVFLLNLTGA